MNDNAITVLLTHACRMIPQLYFTASSCAVRRKFRADFSLLPGHASGFAECEKCPGHIPRGQAQEAWKQLSERREERLEHLDYSDWDFGQPGVQPQAKTHKKKCKCKRCGTTDEKKFRHRLRTTCYPCLLVHQQEYRQRILSDSPVIKRNDTKPLYRCPKHGTHSGYKVGAGWSEKCPQCWRERIAKKNGAKRNE